ncbi:MAG TPA: lysylphosphatidylglycerol synthase transmembrane domain-containing protein [Anaerolineaceae bacterium]
MSLRQDKPDRRSVWIRLAGTLLTLALLVFLLYRQGWQEIWQAFLRISPWRLAAALGFVVLSRLAVTARWYILLRSAGEPLSLWKNFRLTFAGLFASNFLPTTIGGDVFRLAGAVLYRVDTALAAASLIVDRLVGMAGMATAAPLGLARVVTVGLPAILAPGNASLGTLAAGMAHPGWISRLWRQFTDLLRRTFASFALWKHRPAGLLLAYAATWVHMLATFSSIAICLEGMGEPAAFWLVAGTWSLVYFITLVPVSINGYGLQEVSTVLLYSRLAGISPEGSLTIALLVRTLTMLVSLPGAIFMPEIMAKIRNDEEKEAS